MSCGDVYMIDGERFVLIKVEEVASDFHGEGEPDDGSLKRHYAEQGKKPTGKRYHFENKKQEKIELNEYGMREANAQPTGEHEEVSSCTISGGKKSRRSKKSRGRGSKKSRRSNKKRQSKRTK